MKKHAIEGIEKSSHTHTHRKQVSGTHQSYTYKFKTTG